VALKLNTTSSAGILSEHTDIEELSLLPFVVHVDRTWGQFFGSRVMKAINRLRQILSVINSYEYDSKVPDTGQFVYPRQVLKNRIARLLGIIPRLLTSQT